MFIIIATDIVQDFMPDELTPCFCSIGPAWIKLIGRCVLTIHMFNTHVHENQLYTQKLSARDMGMKAWAIGSTFRAQTLHPPIEISLTENVQF